MPIFYNFRIFLATFYIIFGTNILIQCPVPVPVCCMFFVSQKIHINQSPNAIKIYRDLFWNICHFWEEESTQDGARGGHKATGRGRGVGRAVLPCDSLVSRLKPFFRRKKDNFSRKFPSKFQPHRSYGSPEI